MSERLQGRRHRHALARTGLGLISMVGLLLTLSAPTYATTPIASKAGGDTGNFNTTTLEIGIFPYLSTRTLLTTYQPLQQYLQSRLQRPVLFVTAPNMRTFVARTQSGEYRFVLTAPHFARLAQREADYRPMLRTGQELRGLLVVDRSSPLQNIGELRGKTVATPSDIAIISMLGAQLLRANELRPGEDVKLQAMPSHDVAVLSLRDGSGVAAAVVAAGALRQMPEELKSGIRILATTDAVASIMYLAHPKTPRRELAAMTRLLLDFSEASPAGRQFMSNTGFLGLRPPTAAEMKSLDPYVADLKLLLGTAP